jgi:predicted membrane protein
MIFRPKRRWDDKDWERHWKGKWDKSKWKDRWEHHYHDNSTEDIIDSTTVFGGVKKNIITKDFKGGDITTFFGGTDIDLMQADFTGKAVVDITQVFGGTKLVVPPHWQIKSEDLVCLFGAIEDKRPIRRDIVSDDQKILVLRGVCIFGGIDIKSY